MIPDNEEQSTVDPWALIELMLGLVLGVWVLAEK
jgi:hypothetical protein